MRRIYVAGGITDVPDFRERFADIAERLRKAGWQVIDPAELSEAIHPDDFDRPRAMRIDIPLLLTCDAIYMLDGWRLSIGARCEHDIAKVLELDVFYQPYSFELPYIPGPTWLEEQIAARETRET